MGIVCITLFLCIYVYSKLSPPFTMYCLILFSPSSPDFQYSQNMSIFLPSNPFNKSSLPPLLTARTPLDSSSLFLLHYSLSPAALAWHTVPLLSFSLSGLALLHPPSFTAQPSTVSQHVPPFCPRSVLPFLSPSLDPAKDPSFSSHSPLTASFLSLSSDYSIQVGHCKDLKK